MSLAQMVANYFESKLATPKHLLNANPSGLRLAPIWGLNTRRCAPSLNLKGSIPSVKKQHVPTSLSAGKIAKQLFLSVASNAHDVATSAISIQVNLSH